MDIQPSYRTAVGGLCVAALSTFLLTTGCNQSEAAMPRGASTEEAAPAAPMEGKSKIDEDVYTLEMKGAGKYKAGQEGAVEVTLVAKGEYHINDQFPIKFKAADPGEGVTYPKPILKREDGKIEEVKGTLKVPFVAAKAGKTKVAGVLSFSVCSKANCRIEKQALAAVVDVE